MVPPCLGNVQIVDFTNVPKALGADRGSRRDVRRAPLAARQRGSPIFRAHIPSVLREQPMVAVEVLDSKLALAIASLVELFHDPGAGGSGSLELRVHIVDEHGERSHKRCAAARYRSV